MSRKPPNRPGISFEVGAKVEAQDYLKKWYPARVEKLEPENGKLLVHFERWSHRYDEWISWDSSRLRPLERPALRKEGLKDDDHDKTEFRDGEEVLARWTDCRFYPAKIEAVNKDGMYRVQFYDGVVRSVKRIHIKSMPEDAKGQDWVALVKAATATRSRSLSKPRTSNNSSRLRPDAQGDEEEEDEEEDEDDDRETDEEDEMHGGGRKRREGEHKDPPTIQGVSASAGCGSSGSSVKDEPQSDSDTPPFTTDSKHNTGHTDPAPSCSLTCSQRRRSQRLAPTSDPPPSDLLPSTQQQPASSQTPGASTEREESSHHNYCTWAPPTTLAQPAMEQNRVTDSPSTTNHVVLEEKSPPPITAVGVRSSSVRTPKNRHAREPMLSAIDPCDRPPSRWIAVIGPGRSSEPRMSKLSLRGKEPSSKLSRWVEPSFGDVFGSASSSSSTGGSKPGRKPRPRASAEPGGGVGGAAGGGPRRRKTTTAAAAGVGGGGGGGDRAESSVLAGGGQTSSSQGGGHHDDVPWVDTYAPHSQADLAVHKKKVEEVENWMRAHVDLKTSKGSGSGSVLLLSGPSGCGKSATVQVLCRELGFRQQEWSNPSSSAPAGPWSERTEPSDAYKQSFDPGSRFGGFGGGTSQTAQFQDFLLRASKYNRLQMAEESSAPERTLILVEDFPNQFYRQPASLHHILRRFAQTARCPLVFIVSDSLSGDSSSRLLFPKDLQGELNICHISFNPVAPTSLMKVLTRIATQEAATGGANRRVAVPDRAALELLCSGSSGDIRSAINSLQFSSFTDSSVERAGSLASSKKGKPASSSSSSGRAPRGKRKCKDGQEQEVEQAIGGKDASLFLFRALGKILYCKREAPVDPQQPEGPTLPAHLSEHHRARLLEDPELVVERSHMSADFFNLYLHQNYLDFFSEVEDVTRASEYLSDADFLTGEWANRSTMGSYGSSVATRGLLHSNRGHVAVGFRPLHKPSWLMVSKKHRENCLAAQSLFAAFCLAPVSLQTELLPYLSMLETPLRNQAQITFIQDVGRLPRRVFPGRFRAEALTDKDPGTLEADSDEEETPAALQDSQGGPGGAPDSQGGPGGGPDSMPASQPRPAITEDLLEDEDLLIEEYDSD